MNLLKKWWLAILATPIIIVLIASGSYAVWASTPPEPMPQALEAVQSDSKVKVDNTKWLTFRPAEGKVTTGYIFYPGGRVDYRSYSPMAKAIAAEGYLVVVPQVLLNLAFFDINRADEIVAAFPEIKSWAIGGHSLGGTAASIYTNTHLNKINGLVLNASYPADNTLASAKIKALSIYASNDLLATLKKIDASRSALPADTQFVLIEGGNHGQFGWYGLQSGDGTATISREAQQKTIVEATVKFLKEISR